MSRRRRLGKGEPGSGSKEGAEGRVNPPELSREVPRDAPGYVLRTSLDSVFLQKDVALMSQSAQ